MRGLDCTPSDHVALPSLCLILALMRGTCVDPALLQAVRWYPRHLSEVCMLGDWVCESSFS